MLWGELRRTLRGDAAAPALLARHLADGWPATEALGREVARRWLGLCQRQSTS